MYIEKEMNRLVVPANHYSNATVTFHDPATDLSDVEELQLKESFFQRRSTERQAEFFELLLESKGGVVAVPYGKPGSEELKTRNQVQLVRSQLLLSWRKKKVPLYLVQNVFGKNTPKEREAYQLWRVTRH